MASADPIAQPDLPLRIASGWRQSPLDAGSGPRPNRVSVARWTSLVEGRFVSPPSPGRACHIVEVNLRPTDVALFVGGKAVHDGRLPAGSAIMVEAAQTVSADYRTGCDLLHLFVPIPLFERLARGAGPASFGVFAAADLTIRGLSLSLLAANELEGWGAHLYAESIAAAIVARLVSRAAPSAGSGPPRRAGLMKWRLKRVLDHVEANLSGPITLPDLAAVAGLSRMHFASQFRAATGWRPHDYVVRRRIERAQELLRDPHVPLVQVALSVGFQTQAHFTTVFRALICETPGRWRKLQVN